MNRTRVGVLVTVGLMAACGSDDDDGYSKPPSLDDMTGEQFQDEFQLYVMSRGGASDECIDLNQELMNADGGEFDVVLGEFTDKGCDDELIAADPGIYVNAVGNDAEKGPAADASYTVSFDAEAANAEVGRELLSELDELLDCNVDSTADTSELGGDYDCGAQ